MAGFTLDSLLFCGPRCWSRSASPAVSHCKSWRLLQQRKCKFSCQEMAQRHCHCEAGWGRARGAELLPHTGLLVLVSFCRHGEGVGAFEKGRAVLGGCDGCTAWSAPSPGRPPACAGNDGAAHALSLHASLIFVGAPCMCVWSRLLVEGPEEWFWSHRAPWWLSYPMQGEGRSGVWGQQTVFCVG